MFVFFGLVAVVGTAYLSLGHVTALAVVAAIPVGLLATALLVVNNLRDINTDREAGKRTLAVRLGAPGDPPLLRHLRDRCARDGGRHRVLATGGAVGPARRRSPPCPRFVACSRAPPGVTSSRPWSDTGTLQLAFGALLALGIAL